jgi:hypothetical protein
MFEVLTGRPIARKMSFETSALSLLLVSAMLGVRLDLRNMDSLQTRRWNFLRNASMELIV